MGCAILRCYYGPCFAVINLVSGSSLRTVLPADHPISCQMAMCKLHTASHNITVTAHVCKLFEALQFLKH